MKDKINPTGRVRTQIYNRAGELIHDETGSWKAQFEAEQAHILEHTQRLYHYSQVDTLQSYPDPVKKIMNRIRRLKADFLLRRIL